MADLKEHAQRFNTGAASYMTAGSMVFAVVGWGVAFWFATNLKDPAIFIAFFSCGVAGTLLVIYDCGRRIRRAESKKYNGDDLALFLGMITTRVSEIERQSEQDYYRGLDPTDGTDPRSDTVVWYIKQRLPECAGAANAALFNDLTGMPPPLVPHGHAYGTLEIYRQKNLSTLRYYAKTLREIINRPA